MTAARVAPALSAVLAGVVLASAISAQPPARVVITGARVLDVAAGRYRDAGAVVIEGDRIAALDATPPDGSQPATRIDATGKTIVPGMIDLAAVALPSVDLDVDYFYALSLAHGVTGMRVVDTVLPWSVTQRDRIRKGDIVAPRLWTSGPALVARRAPSSLATLITRDAISSFALVDAASAGREALRQADARVDWVRLGADVPADVVKTVVASIGKRSVAVSAAPGAASMAQLAAIRVDAIDGLAAPLKGLEPSQGGEPETVVGEQERDGASKTTRTPRPSTASAAPGSSPNDSALLDASWLAGSAGDLAALARRVAQARVCVIPMLRVASERVSAQPSDALDAELALVPERLRPARREAVARVAAVGSAPGSAAARAWEAKRRFVAAANQAGGTIGVASGAGKNGWPVPGLSVHHELALLVAAGLTPAEAIRAATMGAAATLGSSRTLGQVRPGAAADLLIVEGDPLADITALRKITHVLRAGEVLDPKALLAQARRAGGRGR
jgi:hypothetical protein